MIGLKSSHTSLLLAATLCVASATIPARVASAHRPIAFAARGMVLRQERPVTVPPRRPLLYSQLVIPRGRGLVFASVPDRREDKLVGMQKEQSSKIKGGCSGDEKEAGTISNITDHLEHQLATFDSMADFFNSDEASPDEIKPILRALVRRSLELMVECFLAGVERRNTLKREEATGAAERDGEEGLETKVIPDAFRILDVGCGTGALFPYFLEEADKLGFELSITGIDLSPKMASLAERNAKEFLEMKNGEQKHEIEIVTGDFVELVLGAGYDGEGDGVENEKTERFRNKYDAVVINACFGNFFDTGAVMTAAAQSLSKDGVLCVTHPLGAKFVRKLHEEDSYTVPNCLPGKDEFNGLCLLRPFQGLEFVEDMDIPDDGKMKNSDAYFACARRTPHRALPQIIRLRGPVAEGYGRGGKKLGFPTANLPSSLFVDALVNVSTGVYFGWAVIENQEGGSENPEKIVEAHLMPSVEISGDFYNETMRLALSGFLRPERKFPSFPDLISAINNDVACAKEALDLQPFASLQADKFIADPCNSSTQEILFWKGEDGGDVRASWEFQDIKEAMHGLSNAIR